MKGFVGNIEKETVKNTNYRKVLFTGKHQQLVVMCLKPGEEIGREIHQNTDQFFRIEEGSGIVEIDASMNPVKVGDGIIVSCGSRHNVINISRTKFLKLYTIYSPPEHKDGVVQKNKSDPERVPR